MNYASYMVARGTGLRAPGGALEAEFGGRAEQGAAVRAPGAGLGARAALRARPAGSGARGAALGARRAGPFGRCGFRGAASATIARLLVLLLAAAWGAGCDNALDPFVSDRDANPFYIFGYLDTAADTQFVRVEPIRRSFDPLPVAPLDATVRTTAQHSGTVIQWRDSLVTLADGSVGHLFFARFSPDPGAEYLFEVVREDGATSRSRTHIPAAPSVEIGNVQVLSSSVIQSVIWDDISRAPVKTTLTYFVSETDEFEPVAETLTYDARARLEGDSWIVQVRLLEDRNVLAQRLGSPPIQSDFAFYGMEMNIRILSEEWDNIDGDHVENGAGFFGAIGAFSAEWQLPAHVLDRLDLVGRYGR